VRSYPASNAINQVGIHLFGAAGGGPQVGVPGQAAGEGALSDPVDGTPDALVNTVNTVGIMGKGLALQFKQTLCTAVLTEIIGNWSERKGRFFTEAHVGKAVSWLEETWVDRKVAGCPVRPRRRRPATRRSCARV
jgi:hypothetical protein